jgi:hypothetical protein
MNRIALLNEFQEEEYKSQAPAQDETKKWVNDNCVSQDGLSHRKMTGPYEQR